MTTAADKQRFWSKVDQRTDAGCWPWTASIGTWGYGSFYYQRRNVNASRIAYLFTFGSIPDGNVVCHRCDNPACCNPAHLFVGTPGDNVRDCNSKGRAVFKRGEDHHRAAAKLTPDLVREAKRLYFDEGVTQTEIGRRFGMHASQISRTVSGLKWAHVK